MAFAETALVLLRLLISGIIGLIVLFTNGYVRVPKYILVSQRVWLARLDNTRIKVWFMPGSSTTVSSTVVSSTQHFYFYLQ